MTPFHRGIKRDSANSSDLAKIVKLVDVATKVRLAD